MRGWNVTVTSINGGSLSAQGMGGSSGLGTEFIGACASLLILNVSVTADSESGAGIRTGEAGYRQRSSIGILLVSRSRAGHSRSDSGSGVGTGMANWSVIGPY
jgi:hypothetical protein